MASISRAAGVFLLPMRGHLWRSRSCFGFVSQVETVCFAGGNKVFPIEKQQDCFSLTISVDYLEPYS